jgi:methionyl-tRNA formyltransferase
MNKIKTIFIGTAEIGVPLLKSISNDNRFDVNLVITQIDKTAGRKMELTPSPIKKAAKRLMLTIFQPENINKTESIEKIERFSPELIIVFAYGQILSKRILDIPKYGCLNVHASILPKYRGASPIQSTLLGQENESGISLMKMEEKMDTGPIYKAFPISIEENDNSISLTEKLAHLASENIPDEIINIIENNLNPVPQKESNASYCQKILKTEGLIDWNEDVKIINARIKAYAGWPTTYTFWNGKRLKIIEAYELIEDPSEKAGTVVEKSNNILIAGKNGYIKPTYIQIEGKNPQSITDFINGNPDFINSKLSATP